MSLGVDEQQIVKVPIFVDIGEFEHEPNGEEGESDSFPGYEKVIFSAGRLEPEKDFATLLRAFKKIRDVYAGALLIIVGSGREHGRLVRLAEWLGIDSNVRFLPWTHDIHPYYRKTDVYVQSSLYEGWGMTIIEAMASGAPVVMTDVGCAGEIVLDGETGLIVPPSDATEMSEAILRMLGDNELRERIVEQAKLKVRELPSKEETAVLYKESWDRALKHFKKLRSYTPHI
jgi:glycosyltransferase involved in cell wall biosynthesis